MKLCTSRFTVQHMLHACNTIGLIKPLQRTQYGGRRLCREPNTAAGTVSKIQNMQSIPSDLNYERETSSEKLPARWSGALFWEIQDDTSCHLQWL
jgi:hypothetical protein